MSVRVTALILFLVILAVPVAASADETSRIIVINNQRFDPALLRLPAGKKVKLTIRNQGSLPAEFESTDLSREVVIPINGKVTVYVGPLEVGEYQFFNDFNHAIRGRVVVKSDKES